MKVNIYAINDNVKKLMWSFKFNAPCKHFAMNILVQKFLKATNCFIKKVSKYCNVTNNRTFQC